MKNQTKKTNTILNLQKEVITILNKKQQVNVAGGNGVHKGGPVITIHHSKGTWH